MSYFRDFPLVDYNSVLQVNLTRRAGISEIFKTNPSYYLEYSIKESDTPEIIADKIYDDASLAWIVLQFNNITNVFEEWPLKQSELDALVMEKYPDGDAIHHYISIESGAIVDPNIAPEFDLFPVSNFEHEVNLNEAKRNIKLLLPEYVGTVVARHRELMRL